MQYWMSTGYLIRSDLPAATNTSPKKNAGPPKQLLDIPDIKPTYETVAARLLEDETLKAMFQEVQALMGRTIGYSDQAQFIMMHDAYGLPPEVILTIVEYSMKRGKGVAYMCKVGKNWAEEGICTLEDAMDKLEQLARTDRAWTEFTSQFSTKPPKQTDARLALVRKWRFTYGQSAELIYYADETTVEAIDKVNFNYMDKMLTRWNEENLRTPQDVLQAEKPGKAAPAARGGKRPAKGKAAQNNHTASYDSEAYKQKANGPIEYRRKKKEG
ncbi:MAG: DnaD domain protein, partial [Clostridia bacterium]|nr:DnaD domain protein [Clostridia bacterium]